MEVCPSYMGGPGILAGTLVLYDGDKVHQMAVWEFYKCLNSCPQGNYNVTAFLVAGQLPAQSTFFHYSSYVTIYMRVCSVC